MKLKCGECNYEWQADTVPSECPKCQDREIYVVDDNEKQRRIVFTSPPGRSDEP